MLFLLDADTIITGDRLAYPLQRFRVFWEWLCSKGAAGYVKIPLEQYEEIVGGRGEIVDWVRDRRGALLLNEQAKKGLVQRVVHSGYGELNEDEIEQVGRDPFLISYALADADNRTVVTFERSAPSKRRANRKVPDVCATVGVRSCTLYEMLVSLDFTADWRP
ncbi:MAG: DUF4411 family protein [Vulcanimicrobiaceae bacterium]